MASRDKGIVKKPINYKYDVHLKKYNDILNANRQNARVNRVAGGKNDAGVSDYMKIYGVGLGNQGQEPVQHKYSKNSLKVKLEPIGSRGGASNLPKLGGGIRG